MSRQSGHRISSTLQARQRLPSGNRSRKPQARPVLAYRQRGVGRSGVNSFNAPEVWHEPTGDEGLRFHVQAPGAGYIHAATPREIEGRLADLPARFLEGLEVVQLSRMTRKRALFPCYGMQWGCAVYLYPVEATLVERYVRPPRPEQIKEARMYGGRWYAEGNEWRLAWTEKTLKDFYLNNVLIHEVGHIYDNWNTAFEARERYAIWFADEYGFRASRGRR